MDVIDPDAIEAKLKKLFPTAVRLIHYIGLEDCDYVYEVNMNFNTPIDTILNTRCGSTFNTVKFLLDLSAESFPVNNLNQLDINYAYRIELIGYNEDDTEIETGHIFLLIWLGNWFMVDSYFPDRTLTIDSMNISELDVKITNISLNFSQELWKDITYHDSYNIPDSITVSIDAFKFDSVNVDSRIDKRFKELVLLALEHLKTDAGQSDEYVAILGLPEVDVDLAEKYLMSL